RHAKGGGWIGVQNRSYKRSTPRNVLVIPSPGGPVACGSVGGRRWCTLTALAFVRPSAFCTAFGLLYARCARFCRVPASASSTKASAAACPSLAGSVQQVSGANEQQRPKGANKRARSARTKVSAANVQKRSVPKAEGRTKASEVSVPISRVLLSP